MWYNHIGFIFMHTLHTPELEMSAHISMCSTWPKRGQKLEIEVSLVLGCKKSPNLGPLRLLKRGAAGGPASWLANLRSHINSVQSSSELGKENNNNILNKTFNKTIQNNFKTGKIVNEQWKH